MQVKLRNWNKIYPAFGLRCSIHWKLSKRLYQKLLVLSTPSWILCLVAWLVAPLVLYQLHHLHHHQGAMLPHHPCHHHNRHTVRLQDSIVAVTNIKELSCMWGHLTLTWKVHMDRGLYLVIDQEVIIVIHVWACHLYPRREEGGGNASETDSMIHGHCSDPDDDCGVSIDEEEIVPQKASTAEQKPRKRSKKRRSSSTSSVEPASALRSSLTQTVAEVRSPYYSDSSPHHLSSSQSPSSGAGGSGGEQFKPRYITNTEELNKLVRLLEPHS